MRLPDYPIPSEPVRASWGRLVIDYLRSITPRSSSDILVSSSANGTTLQSLTRSAAAGASMDYSVFAFGFSISGAVVTINSGKVRHGKRTPIFVVGTDITITDDQTWIFVSYMYGSGAASITSSTNEPIDDEQTHNHALFLVTLNGSGDNAAASVEQGDIKSLGDIFIPGVFA